jgi:hypothetical protein
MTVQGSVVTETNRIKTCLLPSQFVVSTKLTKIIVRLRKSWQQLRGAIKHFRPYLYGRKFKVVSKGSNFLSNLFKSICKLVKIRHKQRFFILNRMVVWKGVTGYLGHYVRQDQTNWNEWVPYAVCVYNTTVYTTNT